MDVKWEETQMQRRQLIPAVILIAILISGTALAEQVILQPGPTDGKDTHIQGDYPTSTHGTESYLRFGGIPPSGGEAQYLLIQFDLSGLDETSSIVSAQLELYKFGQNGELYGNFSVMKIIEGWSENTVTWNNQPAFDPLAITAFLSSEWHGGPETFTWHAITGLEGLVQFWIENPDQNFGLLIKPTSTHYGYPEVWSSDYSSASLRPKLVIDGTLVPVDESSWSGVKSLY
jgi:hypothetical protein